ncbi:MAG: DUF484 family protein [Alphaproteobacteria bacterium]|nr:DUF484 family protein [Alphaproteobacteria bacterium]
MPLEKDRTGQSAAATMPGEVRDYLLEHPDFLSDNGDLLALLVPPTQRHGDKVEDFQRYMLARLQDHFIAIKDEHDDLMSLMQEHMQRQNRINAAILSLMDETSFESTLKFITRDIALFLDQEAVGLFFEAGGALQPGVYGGLRVVPEGFVDRWLFGRDVVLEEKPSASAELYGDKAGDVRSQALARLYFGENLPCGLLALGHREPMYYATGLATEQIECLGAVIERCIRKWLV